MTVEYLVPGANGTAQSQTISVGGTSTARNKRGLVILHIGDSHTSADFLTGELRRRLQARYGRGGTGYMTAGHPHIGVRSSTVKITASPGWTYKSLQRPDAGRRRATDATVERRDLVPARKSGLDDRASDVMGSAQYQKSHVTHRGRSPSPNERRIFASK